MRRWLVPGLAIALALGGCTRANPARGLDVGGSGGVGVVRAELSTVPPDILCVQLVAALNGRTLPSNFDVVPGKSATLQVADLPVGELTFTAWAYAAACPSIGGRQATWASTATRATVRAGQVTTLSMTLEPVGGVDIGINFGDGGVDMDMGVPLDQGVPEDLSVPQDLTPPRDLMPVRDLTPPRDLAPPPHDLTPPADLAPPTCSGCTASQTCCSGKCVDLSSDWQNCGACGNLCTSGLCGTSFGSSFPAFWNFNGNASFDVIQKSMVLTPSAQGQVGTVIYQQPIRTGDFDVTFDFRITPPPMAADVADGMAFMIEQNGPTAVGFGGGSFGMVGLLGYGVELDTYDNQPNLTGRCGDATNNHVGIDSLATCTNEDGLAMPTPLVESKNLHSYNPSITLADGLWHTCHVNYQLGTMKVSIDGLLRASAALTGFVAGQSYYFGFGAGTGGFYARQEVRNPQVQLFGPVQCL